MGSLSVVPPEHRPRRAARDPRSLPDQHPWFAAAHCDPRRGRARIPVVRPVILPLVVAAALLAGCGGGSGGPTAPTTDTAMQVVTIPNTVPRGTPPPAASASDEQVIRLWADTLRHGDVAGAARVFGLPAITQIQPGAPFLELRTRGQARAFNASLSCGAVLLRTERAEGAHRRRVPPVGAARWLLRQRIGRDRPHRVRDRSRPHHALDPAAQRARRRPDAADAGAPDADQRRRSSDGDRAAGQRSEATYRRRRTASARRRRRPRRRPRSRACAVWSRCRRAR